MMFARFRLFQSHLELAHEYWRKIITTDDYVIDATCGNGHDTLALIEMNPKRLVAMDIQQAALDATRERLSEDQLERVELVLGCHSKFPLNEPVKLIVYNLGYLPGADKSMTTQTKTTLQSLESATQLIQPGGVISITCYPGHPEGKLEEDAIMEWSQTLSPQEWSCCHHRWLNRKKAPSLLLIQKKLSI